MSTYCKLDILSQRVTGHPSVPSVRSSRNSALSTVTRRSLVSETVSFGRETAFIKVKEVLRCTADLLHQKFQPDVEGIQDSIATFCEALMNLVSSCTNKLCNETLLRVSEHHLTLLL